MDDLHLLSINLKPSSNIVSSLSQFQGDCLSKNIIKCVQCGFVWYYLTHDPLLLSDNHSGHHKGFKPLIRPQITDSPSGFLDNVSGEVQDTAPLHVSSQVAEVSLSPSQSFSPLSSR